MSNVSDSVSCSSCGYAGPVLVAHHGYKWWMLPVGFLIACSGLGLIPLAIALIYLGNRTFHCCPQCRNTDLSLWQGIASAEALASHAAAVEADRQVFQRNKLTLLAVVFGMLALALIFMFWQMNSA